MPNVWRQEDKRFFINPYTFVELPDTCDKKPFAEQSNIWRGSFTGSFHCKGKVNTLMALPDHEKGWPNGEHVHKHYPFMSYLDSDGQKHYYIPV